MFSLCKTVAQGALKLSIKKGKNVSSSSRNNSRRKSIKSIELQVLLHFEIWRTPFLLRVISIIASTSNMFARHTRLVSPIVLFSAVLLLLVGASPWSQAAPTTLSPTTICTNTAVSSLKILGSISNLRKDFCDAEKNYVKVRKKKKLQLLQQSQS